MPGRDDVRVVQPVELHVELPPLAVVLSTLYPTLLRSAVQVRVTVVSVAVGVFSTGVARVVILWTTLLNKE